MYKYRLHYLLRQLSYDDYRTAMHWLPQKLFISHSTWLRWIYLPMGSKQNISVEKLELLATFFECNIEDLLTKKQKNNQLKILFDNEK